MLDETSENRVSVFKLNYSELQCMHNEHKIILNNFSYKNVETYKHEYEYSEKFGLLLFIVLIDKKVNKQKFL